jgi:hypothetical protein
MMPNGVAVQRLVRCNGWLGDSQRSYLPPCIINPNCFSLRDDNHSIEICMRLSITGLAEGFQVVWGKQVRTLNMAL